MASDGDRKSGGNRSGGGGRSKQNGRLQPGDAATTAVQLVSQLTGRRPETVLGLHREDDGWKVTLELVELSRVPNTTDVLGCYVVTLDDDGELVGYERVRRYQRGQTGGEEQ
jgi:Gas vesicle synthesis protein GvpO